MYQSGRKGKDESTEAKDTPHEANLNGYLRQLVLLTDPTRPAIVQEIVPLGEDKDLVTMRLLLLNSKRDIVWMYMGDIQQYDWTNLYPHAHESEDELVSRVRKGNTEVH